MTTQSNRYPLTLCVASALIQIGTSRGGTESFIDYMAVHPQVRILATYLRSIRTDNCNDFFFLFHKRRGSQKWAKSISGMTYRLCEPSIDRFEIKIPFVSCALIRRSDVVMFFDAFFASLTRNPMPSIMQSISKVIHLLLVVNRIEIALFKSSLTVSIQRKLSTR